MPTYEKWNGDNTDRLVRVDTADIFKISKLVDKGYLLVVTPELHNPATNKLGSYTFTDNERSWLLIDLTIQELQDLADAEAQKAIVIAANQKILDFEYIDLQYWQQTDSEIDTVVNGIFDANAASSLTNLTLACRLSDKKLAKGLRDIVDVIQQLRTIGTIPK